MARLVKEIKSTVRLGKKSYRPGDEDALESVVTPGQGQRLLDKGAIEGDWEFAGTNSPSSSVQQESAPAPTPDEVLIQKLQGAGYDTEEAVKAASDDELKGKGFNPASIKAIRKLYPAN